MVRRMRPTSTPHQSGSVAIVRNGIIENYRELREELEGRGTDVDQPRNLAKSAMEE